METAEDHLKEYFKLLRGWRRERQPRFIICRLSTHAGNMPNETSKIFNYM